SLAVIERCARQDPDATTCLAQRTLIDGLAGNCARLERDAQRILAHDPASDVGYFLLASASYAQGRSVEAVRELLNGRAGRAREAATGAHAFLLRKDAWIAEPRGEDFSILRDLTPRLLLAERRGGLLTPAAFEAERAKWIDLWEHSAVAGVRPFVWLHGY